MRLGLLVLVCLRVLVSDSDWCQCQGFIYLLRAYLLSRIKAAPAARWARGSKEQTLKERLPPRESLGSGVGKTGVKWRIDHYFGAHHTSSLFICSPRCVRAILVIWHFRFVSRTIYFTFIRHQDILIFVLLGAKKYCQPETIICWAGSPTKKRLDWPSYEGHMPMSLGRNQSWLITWARRPVGLMTCSATFPSVPPFFMGPPPPPNVVNF